VPQDGFDPDKGEALLVAAGGLREGDGIRRNTAGEKLSLTIMTTSGDRTRELVQQVIQSQFRRVGIELLIRNQPARVLFGQTITQRSYPGLAMYAWFSAPENVPRSTLHSEEIPTAENNWAGQNYPGFRNTEVDALIDKVELELDRNVRKLHWERLQQIYATELPVLPLYYRANVYVLPRWLAGLVPTGHQDPSSLAVEDWRAKP